MIARSLRRFSSAVDLLRPRTFFRTLARVDQVMDATRELAATVETLRIRTEQLMTIERLDWEQRDELEQLGEQLDPHRIACHVTAAVNAAQLHCDPFPHLIVNDWLPADVYRTIVNAVPPSVFFAEREVGRERLLVPFAIAPAYSQRVWRFVTQEIVGQMLQRTLSDRFKSVIAAHVRTFCPEMPDRMEPPLHPSDGRIMLRRPGYVIPPHRDPKWGFVTGLAYLARPGDNETYGTQLYSVEDDEEAPTSRPFYVEQHRAHLVKAVPFRANTLLAFLNSAGAHGASIPADAQPPTLERLVYQFRLGPDSKSIKQLLSLMPPDRRPRWSGAKADKAERA